MAISLRETVNINEFINLSTTEKLLPKFMTNVKSVRVSTVDKLMVSKNDSLSDIDLLKGVKLIEGGYVSLVGLVVSGEWNLPDNCAGGVSICLVDKRLKVSKEATLGSYNAPACKKQFSFKIIPNYAVTTADAKRAPWQILVNIKGVRMENGWCPLSLEFVSVCIVHKNNVKLGLREKITNVSDNGPIELTEAVVDEFVESVPMAERLEKFKRLSSFGGNRAPKARQPPRNNKSFNNRVVNNNNESVGSVVKKDDRPEPAVNTGPVVTEFRVSDDGGDDESYDASWLSF
ncbi:movement protein [Tobacco latent virus]|uniref:Movement protein n=1 Tax=Tobacco latent virus TaxID=2083209 RepID=Q7TG49_9VIRU|nr:movement protein [Tobacco latent virus]AAN17780.1 movement protein [Tobacco latent virus]